MVCATVGTLAVLCRAQVGYWRDDLSLYRHTLAVTTDNWMIRNNLGKAYVARGELEPAVAEFRESLRIMPSFVLARHNLAGTLARQGRLADAVAEYRTALGYNPFDADLHVGLAELLERQGDGAQASREYRLALQMRPQRPTSIRWWACFSSGRGLRRRPGVSATASESHPGPRWGT